MPPQLLAVTGGPSIFLDKPIVLIGRHPECDIQIDSRKISRRHCCVALVADYLVVRDLGSTNGIHINGVRTMEGRLRQGDELTIGDNRYKVEWNNGSNGSPRVIPAAEPPVRSTEKDKADDDPAFESSDSPVPLAGLSDAPRALPAVPPPANAAPKDAAPDRSLPPESAD